MFENTKIYNQNIITQAEKKTFEKKDSFSVMKIAAKACSQYILSNYKPKRILILCGPGNNGGDGFIIAKHLQNRGHKIEVYIFGDKNNYAGDAFKALKSFKSKTKNIDLLKLAENALIIDALFGIGLKRKIKGKLEKLFKQINNSNNVVLSVDIPSGISSNTGKILGIAIKANFTITFHRKKKGHTLGFGKEYSGKLKVVDIGFT